MFYLWVCVIEVGFICILVLTGLIDFFFGFSWLLLDCVFACCVLFCFGVLVSLFYARVAFCL